MFHTIAIISTDVNQDNCRNSENCQGTNVDSTYYEDMVNRLMENNCSEGSKRKITSSTYKRTKRFKRSKRKP